VKRKPRDALPHTEEETSAEVEPVEQPQEYTYFTNSEYNLWDVQSQGITPMKCVAFNAALRPLPLPITAERPPGKATQAQAVQACIYGGLPGAQVQFHALNARHAYLLI
jgi:hypothetical protein